MKLTAEDTNSTTTKDLEFFDASGGDKPEDNASISANGNVPISGQRGNFTEVSTLMANADTPIGMVGCPEKTSTSGDLESGGPVSAVLGCVVRFWLKSCVFFACLHSDVCAYVISVAPEIK